LNILIADTVAYISLAVTYITIGAVAEAAAERRTSKYAALMQLRLFVPLATETFGPICAEGQSFIRDIGKPFPPPHLIRETQPSVSANIRRSAAIQCHLFSDTFQSTSDAGQT
jgi:hypothetical protein